MAWFFFIFPGTKKKKSITKRYCDSSREKKKRKNKNPKLRKMYNVKHQMFLIPQSPRLCKHTFPIEH